MKYIFLQIKLCMYIIYFNWKNWFWFWVEIEISHALLFNGNHYHYCAFLFKHKDVSDMKTFHIFWKKVLFFAFCVFQIFPIFKKNSLLVEGARLLSKSAKDPRGNDPGGERFFQSNWTYRDPEQHWLPGTPNFRGTREQRTALLCETWSP